LFNHQKTAYLQLTYEYNIFVALEISYFAPHPHGYQQLNYFFSI
jgi:hypothetical protein